MGWGSRQGPASFDPGPRLRALAELLERPRGILEAIGGLIVKESGKAFREQRLGNFPWKPRVNPNWPALLRDAESGAAKPPQRRFQERPALMDTGLLARSIAHRVVSNTDVEVGVAGVAKVYGDKHQVGGEVESVIVTKAIQHRIWKWISSATGSDKKTRARRVSKATAARIASDPTLARLNADLKAARAEFRRESKALKQTTAPAGLPQARRIARGKVDVIQEKISKRRRELGAEVRDLLPPPKAIAWGGKEKRGRAAAGLEKVRWLLNPHLRGQRIRHRIHARPFIGLPGTLVQEIERTIGVSVRQVR